MEIRNLKTFLQVVESGSFSKAAEALGYTQSTVSFQISQLEEELNCQLFDRIGRNIYLTSRGELLQKHALAIDNSLDVLKEDFRQEEKPAGVVHMYSADSICEKMMLLNYDEFYRTYPDIRLVFSTGSTTDLLEVLERNQSDVIFTLDDHVYRQNFIIAEESPIKMRFVAGNDFPLAGKKKLSIRDIVKYPMMLTESGMSYRKIFDDHLSRLSLQITPVLETGRTDIIVRCLYAGNAVSFLPEFVVRDEVEAGKLVFLDVEDFDITIWKQLIYRKDKWISKALQAFIDFVIEHEFRW